MRINKLKFDKTSTDQVGLKEINLERLGSVVALIGKNGSGKTRILNFIEQNLNPNFYDFLDQKIILPPDIIKDAIIKIEPFRNYLNLRNELDSIKVMRQKDPKNEELKLKFREVRGVLMQNEQSLSNYLPKPPIAVRSGVTSTQKTTTFKDIVQEIISNVNPSLGRLKADYIKKVDYNQIRQLQEVITEKGKILTSFEELIESVTNNIDYNEFGSIYSSALRYLKKLPHQLSYDFLDCLGDSKKFEKRVSYSRYKALETVFRSLIGKKLEWETQTENKNLTENGVQITSVGKWKIDGREFDYSEFSEGEKTLFAYVLLFFLMSQNKSIRLKESIILIDEPELHLHPDAEIDLINGIRAIIEDRGQLWIATHSINILSHLNFDEVFTVKDGGIFHPTKTIQRQALSELMKIEERVQKLSEFVNSISDWTFVHFMIECFTNPEVIEVAKADDPQIKSLKELINFPDGVKKKVLLDFGAGKGRLYDQVENDENFSNLIEYSALEPNTEFHQTLLLKGVKNIYASPDEIKGIKFDFIVLCNVLHEIEIEEWVPSLNDIINHITEDGSLILIEAKSLIKGEKIGRNGFILLEEDEVKTLFGLDNEPISLKHKTEYQNITSVLLPKSSLTIVTNENLLLTLDMLQDKCFSKIEKLREQSDMTDNNSNQLGRQSAFLSQQYINAKLAYKQISQLLRKTQAK